LRKGDRDRTIWLRAGWFLAPATGCSFGHAQRRGLRRVGSEQRPVPDSTVFASRPEREVVEQGRASARSWFAGGLVHPAFWKHWPIGRAKGRGHHVERARRNVERESPGGSA